VTRPSFTRLSLALFATVFLAVVAQSQVTPAAWSPETLQQLRQVQQAALADDYAYQQVAHLTDNIGPRLIGSSQAAAAVQYVAEELRKLGLDVTLEKVMVPHWVRGEERAELISYPGQAPGTTQKIVVTALASPNNGTGADGITAEVVVVNNFAELAALPADKVAGRIVVFNYPFDERMTAAGFALQAYGEAVAYRAEGPAAAARRGALAALVRSAGSADFRLPHTGLTEFPAGQPTIPSGAITAEDAALMARLAAQGTVRMHLLLTSKMLPEVESYNVIGDLKGSEHPEQVVIVSGHLDSWDLGTGALDDGAGVAIAMEAAQVLKQLHLQPRRTIRVVAWMAEEMGVFGGKVYGKEHATQVPDHYAAIETDLGAGHPVGINACCDEAMLPLFQPLGALLQTSGAGIVRASEETGADILPLKVAGVPTFSPIQDVRTYFDYHHSAADTLDKIDARQLRENATVIAVLAYALANMNAQLPRKPQPVPEWMK